MSFSSVRVVAVISDPHNLRGNVVLVQSDWLLWGELGWTATLRARSTHSYEGEWGANWPNYEPCTVPVGEHRMVLAVSGEFDDWAGWHVNLHHAANVSETIVQCLPHQQVEVRIWVTLGSEPTYTGCMVSMTPPCAAPSPLKTPSLLSTMTTTIDAFESNCGPQVSSPVPTGSADAHEIAQVDR